MTVKQNISAIVKLGRKDPLRASIAVLMVLILPLMIVNTLTQVLLQTRATIDDPNNLGANGSQQTQVSYTSDILRPGYTPTPNNNNSTSDVLRPGYTPEPPSTSDVLRPGYTPTPNNNNSTSDILRPGYTPTPNNNNSTSDILRPGYTPTPNNTNSSSDVSTPDNTSSSDTGQGGTPELSSDSNDNDSDNNNDENNNNNDNGSGSSNNSRSSGSNSLASSEFTATTTSPVTTQTGNMVSCQTGFNRPLLFGVSPDGGSAYEDGPGATLKNAGSTMATVPLNWDVIQPSGPQDYNANAMVNFPINKAIQTGRVVVVNLSGTPNWATGNEGLPPHKAQPNKANDVVNREFKELVRQAVRDNKAKVKYWSYWNEPNGCMSSKGDCGYTGDSLEDFAYWHQVFYDTVKAEDPTAKVIFGNLDFTGPNVNFIRDAHNLDDIDVKYDYLGINAYNKNKNAAFPVEWVKAGYDAQPSDHKKPVWLNEWGFDRQWWGCSDGACRDQARQDIARLIEDGFNKIYAAEYIYAAQYHNLRDLGGDYGLWDNDAPRPGGAKFLEIVNNKCNPQYGNIITPPSGDIGACVVASHDLGGDFLKRGQPITLTSVASKPVKTFKYAFYNSDNKKSNGIANHFCVKGAKEVAGDDCPNGSGQLIVEVNGDNNFEGAMQAASWLKLPNGNVIDSVWRGNLGWNRSIPYNASIGSTNAIKWNFSGYLGIDNYGTFRSTAEIDALDFYTADNKTGYMEIWRNNIGKRTTFSFNAAGDYPDWSKSSNTAIADLNKTKTALPGDGVITAAGSFVASSKLFQIHWRGSTEWMRTVPIASGKPDFSKATPYLQTRQNSVLPTPNAKVQAINFMVMPDNRIQEQIWINNQAYQRFIPTTGGVVDFSKATTYNRGASITGLTENSNLTDSVTLNYSQLHVIDQATGKIPENLQINATFTTETGTIKDDGKCVMRFAFSGTIDGDVDGNCVNDIYDYNVLMQYYNTDNCVYNIAGANGCRIDMEDVNFLKKNWGNKCE